MVCRRDALSGHECGRDDGRRASLVQSATDVGRVDLDGTPSSSAELRASIFNMAETDLEYTYYS